VTIVGNQAKIWVGDELLRTTNSQLNALSNNTLIMLNPVRLSICGSTPPSAGKILDGRPEGRGGGLGVAVPPGTIENVVDGA
jgi:hypothetical protein